MFRDLFITGSYDVYKKTGKALKEYQSHLVKLAMEKYPKFYQFLETDKWQMAFKIFRDHCQSLATPNKILAQEKKHFSKELPFISTIYSLMKHMEKLIINPIDFEFLLLLFNYIKKSRKEKVITNNFYLIFLPKKHLISKWDYFEKQVDTPVPELFLHALSEGYADSVGHLLKNHKQELITLDNNTILKIIIKDLSQDTFHHQDSDVVDIINHLVTHDKKFILELNNIYDNSVAFESSHFLQDEIFTKVIQVLYTEIILNKTLLFLCSIKHDDKSAPYILPTDVAQFIVVLLLQKMPASNSEYVALILSLLETKSRSPELTFKLLNLFIDHSEVIASEPEILTTVFDQYMKFARRELEDINKIGLLLGKNCHVKQDIKHREKFFSSYAKDTSSIIEKPHAKEKRRMTM